MCDPVSASFATAIALQGVGTAQQYNAQKAAGRAQSNYYNYVAEQQRIEAEEAVKAGERRAKLSAYAGSQQSAQYGREASQFNATQLARLAANGVGADSVSTFDVASDSIRKELLDQEAIRYNADTEGYQARQNASYKSYDLKNQATLNKMSADNARKAASRAATATLIEGASRIASSSYNFYNSRPPTVRIK